MQTLVLGSTSPYRRALLEKLGLPFVTDSPDLDEAPLIDETPEQLVARLAKAKALAVGHRHTDALVIGSDQVACIGGRILGKPGSQAVASQQLQEVSGKSVVFNTGLCLLNTGTGHAQVVVEPFSVHFRTLSNDQISRYLERERPYDCAGSFKSEGMGITLFRSMEGRDPNALIGLPLIALVDMLANEGVRVP